MANDKSWIKWVAIGCGGLVLLVVIFAGALFYFVRAATAGPEQVAKEFLAAAAAGDAERAHLCFSAPLREAQPLAELAAAMAAKPALFAVADTSFTERSVDMNGAKLAGTAKLTAGTEVPISFSFAKENGAWKILGYHIGSEE